MMRRWLRHLFAKNNIESDVHELKLFVYSSVYFDSTNQKVTLKKN